MPLGFCLIFLQDFLCPWHRTANPSILQEDSEERMMLTWTACRKGTNQSSHSLSFHSHLPRQHGVRDWAKDRLQSSVSPLTDCQTLLPERWLCGSPEGKSSTTCSGEVWPEGEPILEFYSHLTSSIHPFISPLLPHCQQIVSCLCKIYCL